MDGLYERIQTLCKAKGVTGSRMCLDLGISKSTLSDIKCGRKKGISTDNAQKIASYLGITVGYLLGEEETKKAPTVIGERDVLDDIDFAFYGEYKELTEDDKETIRDMVRIMRQRRAAQDKR